MTDGSTPQETQKDEQRKTECAEGQETTRVASDPIEQRIAQRVEQAVRAVGAGARRVRAVLRERATAQRAETSGGHPPTEAPGEIFRVPDEVRGLVERYPLPAMLASCGAGYLLGALATRRRRA
jgi:hypothetical protein